MVELLGGVVFVICLHELLEINLCIWHWLSYALSIPWPPGSE
jgi:hypothetical protein